VRLGPCWAEPSVGSTIRVTGDNGVTLYWYRHVDGWRCNNQDCEFCKNYPTSWRTIREIGDSGARIRLLVYSHEDREALWI